MKKIVLLFLATTSLLSAKMINLEQSIEIALKNSDAMRIQNINSDITDSQFKSTLWGIVPDASTSFSWSDSDGYEAKSAGFSISKNISSTIPDYFNWRIAQSNILLTSRQNESTIKTIAFNVITNYTTLLINQKKIDISRDNYRIQKRLLQRSELLFSQGRKTIYDLNQVKINALNAKLTLFNMQKLITKNQRDLAYTLGIEMDSIFVEDLNIEPLEVTDFEDCSPEDALTVQTLKIQIEQKKLLLKQDKLRFFPTVELRYSHSNSSLNSKPFEFDNYYDSNSVSLTIGYSLFNFFEHGEVYYRSKANLRIKDIQLDFKLKQIKKDYNNMLFDIKNLILQKEINDEILSQSGENFIIAETNFNLGKIDLLELDKSQKDFNEAKLNNLNIKYEIFLKQQAMDYLLSKKIMGKW